MKKRYGNKLALIVSVSFLFASIISIPKVCYGRTLKIAVSVPLSGDQKNQGQAMLNGVQQYFDRLNDNGGIEGVTYNLIADSNRNLSSILEIFKTLA